MSTSKQTIHHLLNAAFEYPFKTTYAVIQTMSNVIVSSFIAPFIVSILIGSIQTGGAVTLESSTNLIIAYALCQLYGEVIGWRLTLYAMWTMETAAQRNLYQKIYKHLNSMSMDFHANRFGGSLVSQTNKFVGSFERFWDTIIFQMVPSITSIVAAVVIMAFVFWQYAVVLAVISAVFIVIVIRGTKFLAEFNVKESQASTKLTGQLADSMSNILAIKSHGHEEYEYDAYASLATSWRNKSLDNMRGFLKVSSVYAFMTASLNVLALVTALWASGKGLISVSVVYLAVAYTLTVTRQLWEMNNIMRNFNRVIGDANDMTEILAIEPSVIDKVNTDTLSVVRGDILFDSISFAHKENNKDMPLFKNLHLHIRGGEQIGLVGQSGGGKTTLTKLLMRFMDIQKGKILIDGHDITDFKQSELRKFISYVPQEPVLFHRSLRENIRYGRLDATDKEVEIVARLANADEFINKLPKGYDTLVGERGVKLSGGQRQRVVIARAMLKNAPILVLDEATSALDSESEELIQDALWKLMKGRTAIVIAHRLSTIQKMDRIVVLKDGKIHEQGTHKQLVKNNGIYAGLWNKQSGGFIEE